jgi:hypothetical protein
MLCSSLTRNGRVATVMAGRRGVVEAAAALKNIIIPTLVLLASQCMMSPAQALEMESQPVLGSASTIDTMEKEVAVRALLGFYDATGGPKWTPPSGASAVVGWRRTDAGLCDWTGVACELDPSTGHKVVRFVSVVTQGMGCGGGGQGQLRPLPPPTRTNL